MSQARDPFSDAAYKLGRAHEAMSRLYPEDDDIHIDGRHEQHADGWGDGAQYNAGTGGYTYPSGATGPGPGQGTNNPNIGLGSAQGFSNPTQNTNGTQMGGGSTGAPAGVNPGGMSQWGGASNPQNGVFTGQTPAYTPGASAYQYGGTPGGAAAAQATDAAAGQAALSQQAAQAQNPNAAADRSATGGVLSGEGGMANYYEGQLNGTGPNLAAAQAQASTDQGIQAQTAMANSARGPLAAAGASRGAAMSGAAAQQAGAQAAVQGTIQQQQMAQAGLQGLYGQEGQQTSAQSSLDAQTAAANATLAEQQNTLGQNTALGYAGLGANVAQTQLGAQEAEQAANLQAAGMGQQQSQFNTQQNNQMLGTALSTGGAVLGSVAGPIGSAIGAKAGRAAAGNYGGSYGDADFDEPGNPSNGWTLREEQGGADHDPFILALDRQRGIPMKVAMQPLSPAEMRQVNRPHGAGPLNSPERQTTAVGAMPLGGQHADWNLGAAHDAMRPVARSPQRIAAWQPMPALYADADLTDAGTSKFERAHATFQADHDADELYAPVPGDIAGGTERDRKGAAPQQRVGATLDLKGGRYGDAKMYVDPLAKTGVDTSADANPLDAGYSNFNGVDTHPRTLDDQKAERIRARHDEQQASLHEDWKAPLSDRLAAGDPLGLNPTSRGSIDESGGKIDLHPGAAKPGPDVYPPGMIKTVAAPDAQPGAPAQAPPVLPNFAPAGGSGRPGFAATARPQDIAAIQQGGREQLAGVTDARDAEVHQGEDAGIAALQKGDILGRHDTENADLQADRKLDEDRIMTLRANAATDAAKLGENYGFKPSAARSIGMAIAQGLGAAGAALTHGENSAAKIISSQIDRELDAQRQQIESAKGKVSNLDTALAQTYRQTGNMKEALALAHVTQLQKVDQDAQAHAAASNSDAVMAKYEIMHGQIQERIAQEQAKLYRPTVTGGGGQGLTREKFNAQVVALRDKFPDLTSEQAQRQVLASNGIGPSQGALPVHEKDAGEGKPSPRVQKSLSTLDASHQAATELDSILDKGSSLSPSDRARAEALGQQLRRNGYESVPEHPLEVFSSTTARRAGLDEVTKQIAREREDLEERARKGGTGSAGDADK